MGPGDISFQERSGLGAGPRKGEDPACAWPLAGSVVGVSRVLRGDLEEDTPYSEFRHLTMGWLLSVVRKVS